MAHSSNNFIWLRLTCFFYFGGLSCFIPFLTAHLQWLGLTLEEIAAIHLIANVFSALGLLLAICSSSRCGYRSLLAISALISAFCGAGLLFVPRVRDFHSSYGKQPDAEVLCRPEGSLLFFRQCGPTCDLDSVGLTEISISQCRFEPRFKFPVDWQKLVNPFDIIPTLTDNSEPERGDLPRKTTGSLTPQPEQVEQTLQQATQHKSVSQDEDVQSGNSGDNVYDQEDDYTENSRFKRQVEDQIDDDDEELVHSNKPGLSPHLCFNNDVSITTCHVFIGTDHIFKMNTSFYTGKIQDHRCFYALNYHDAQQQIFSDLRCRLNKPDSQVRCQAEGMTLRAIVTHNGTSTCSEEPVNHHRTFWLYLIFRTIGEMAVISSLILLYVVSLRREEIRLQNQSLMENDQQQIFFVSSNHPDMNSNSFSHSWWIWALMGLVIWGPLSGILNYFFGFGAGFLMGSLLFGLASFMMAFSSPYQKLGYNPDLFYSSADISFKQMGAILCHKTALLLLLLILCFGMANGLVHSIFYWHLVHLKAARYLLSITMATTIVFTVLVFLLKCWLQNKCGHNYIFIIGLLLYSIRFLGYSLIYHPGALIALEMLEPLCSCWMLLTAAMKIATVEPKNRFLWKINFWALLLVFHYSFGRGLGSLFSCMAAHHVGVSKVFTGSAILLLLSAAFWFILLHAVIKPQRKFKLFGSKPNQTRSHQDKTPSQQSYTQLEILQSSKN